MQTVLPITNARLTAFAAMLDANIQQALALPGGVLVVATIDVAVDPWKSPVGEQDTASAFRRDLPRLQADLIDNNALELAGFSTERWAEEWAVEIAKAEGDCVVYVDAKGGWHHVRYAS